MYITYAEEQMCWSIINQRCIYSRETSVFLYAHRSIGYNSASLNCFLRLIWNCELGDDVPLLPSPLGIRLSSSWQGDRCGGEWQSNWCSDQRADRPWLLLLCCHQSHHSQWPECQYERLVHHHLAVTTRGQWHFIMTAAFDSNCSCILHWTTCTCVCVYSRVMKCCMIVG